jgi:hypothetical protein
LLVANCVAPAVLNVAVFVAPGTPAVQLPGVLQVFEPVACHVVAVCAVALQAISRLRIRAIENRKKRARPEWGELV